MANYPYTTAVNLPSPIGVNLNVKYIAFNSLPESIKILISNPKYFVLVRESTNTTTSKGGRTSGTMWYNKQILGFVVEDAVRIDKKVQDKTAAPDNIKDASKFNGVPSQVYNVVLSGETSSDFIPNSWYKGKGLRVSSISDRSGINIYEKDVFVSQNFETGGDNPVGVAFSGVWIHHGSSEGSSSGCIIFSRTRKSDNTVVQEEKAVIALNKYLQSVKLVGPGILQTFVIINLWEFPVPPRVTTTVGTVINSETNQPIEGVQVNIITGSQEPLNITPGSQEPLRPETPTSVPVTIEFN